MAMRTTLTTVTLFTLLAAVATAAPPRWKKLGESFVQKSDSPEPGCEVALLAADGSNGHLLSCFLDRGVTVCIFNSSAETKTPPTNALEALTISPEKGKPIRGAFTRDGEVSMNPESKRYSTPWAFGTKEGARMLAGEIKIESRILRFDTKAHAEDRLIWNELRKCLASLVP